MSFFYRLINIITWPIRVLGRVFSRFSGAGNWFVNLSLPTRVAILVAVFLVIFAVAAYVAFFLTADRAKIAYWFEWPRWAIILALMVAIPIVVYHVLKLWLEGEVSQYPDIDYAWQAGLAELEGHGLDPSQVPIFLVLGSAGEQQEKSLLDASAISFRMREVPQGPAALHWYANPDGVYLVCTQTSCLSKLAAVAREAEAAEKAGPLAPPSPGGGAGPDLRGTIVAGSEGPGGSPPAAPVASQGAGLGGGTLGGAPSGTGGSVRGTMVVGGGAGEDEAPGAPEKRPVTVAREEQSEQARRLEYVCRLLRRIRQPLCPVNGILTLLPFNLIQRPREAIEVQRCLQRDMVTASAALMLRCPVAAMVVGMEDEPGFRELVRRVGPHRAAAQRFGKGFSVWNPPIPERMEALAAHACGSFEDWVYTLFREKGSLSKPGNTRLYSLLCKIRLNVRNRLANILAAGFGLESAQAPDAETMLFSGCYFAAAGDSEDRQAFVRGVFDKLPAEQEELDWTERALREDDKYQQWAQLGLAIDTVLILALAGMILGRWVFHWPFLM
ncbi:MAG: type VI secretion protein IcmF/TssM N-terminal domain-containing protein [Planctomycetota bacterium]|jgi:hypothetical protein